MSQSKKDLDDTVSITSKKWTPISSHVVPRVSSLSSHSVRANGLMLSLAWSRVTTTQ